MAAAVSLSPSVSMSLAQTSVLVQCTHRRPFLLDSLYSLSQTRWSNSWSRRPLLPCHLYERGGLSLGKQGGAARTSTSRIPPDKVLTMIRLRSRPKNSVCSSKSFTGSCDPEGSGCEPDREETNRHECSKLSLLRYVCEDQGQHFSRVS